MILLYALAALAVITAVVLAGAIARKFLSSF
jgi:hypothetical protein